VRYINSPTELSWPQPRRGQTVRYIHSPTELSWPGPRWGHTVRYIYSSTELSWPHAATERTDSEIRSFFHWAIMTPATKRTDNEIYSFSHWLHLTKLENESGAHLQLGEQWELLRDPLKIPKHPVIYCAKWELLTNPQHTSYSCVSNPAAISDRGERSNHSVTVPPLGLQYSHILLVYLWQSK